jgi:hypothetical protein
MWYGSVTAEGVPAKGVVDLAYGGEDGDTLFTLAGNGSVSRWELSSRTMTPLFGVDPRPSGLAGELHVRRGEVSGG